LQLTQASIDVLVDTLKSQLAITLRALRKKIRARLDLAPVY
jgi:hypothetical protein